MTPEQIEKLNSIMNNEWFTIDSLLRMLELAKRMKDEGLTDDEDQELNELHTYFEEHFYL